MRPKIALEDVVISYASAFKKLKKTIDKLDAMYYNNKRSSREIATSG